MKRWKKYAAGLLLTTGLSSQVHAQVPAVPAAPVAVPAAAVPVGAVPVAAPAAAPSNIWTFLCLSPEQKAACKAALCNSVLGQMLNNGIGPVSTLSGGLVPSLCPLVNAADLAKPADTAEGAAARAKADEADAKARREAVRFLGTVDCHYWPEAQEALINALRGDRNECVRLEAAFALSRGCCCTKIVIKALVQCVSGSDDDGFPSERSERVRGTAHAALEHCLACYTEVVPVPLDKKKEGDKETPGKDTKPGNGADKTPAKLTQPMTPAEFYKRTQMEPREQIVAEGKRVLAHLQPISQAQVMTAPQEGSKGSVLEIIQHAFGGSSTPETTTTIVRETSPAPTVAIQAPTPTPTVHDSTAGVAKPMPTGPAIPTPTTPAKTTVAEKSAPLPPVAPTPAPVAEKSMNYTSSYQTVKAPDKVTLVASTSTSATKPATTATPATPATENHGMSMTLAQVLATLRESPHPEYRDWAAENLATVDGWTNPDVVQALANAIRTDRVASVRASCVRALGRMRCGTMVAMSAVQSAKNDPDPHVRKEAELALQLVGGVEGASLVVPSGR